VSTPTFYTYEVVDVLPHDQAAWTQGLIYTDSVFYEGTGRNGASSLRKVDPQTGQVLQQVDLTPEYFGEGITLFGDIFYQLTWTNTVGFMYDRAFTEIGRFDYPTQGWGITHDGTQLIVSDGTPTLYFWDPATLQETGRITVTYLGQPVPQLNELEYIDGEIFANVWLSDYIVRIDPKTGVINGVIDLTGLLASAPPPPQPVDVLNGIAYDAEQGRLFVTGKYWPAVFEIRLVPATP
jgi:glutamine cyclotransferase